MTLHDYLQMSFVQNALLVGVLVALCAALLGVTLVLRRFSVIGDGLSHVAFGAMAVAAVLGLTNDMLLVMPVTILCAVLLLAAGANARIKGDAAVAMISVGALAVGYLLMNLFPPSGKANISGDVCTTLFGGTSILTLTKLEVRLSIILSVVVVSFFVLFYHKIFAVTFDESFAAATGANTRLYNLMIAVIIAVVIVLAMNLVGSLLISAVQELPGGVGLRRRDLRGLRRGRDSVCRRAGNARGLHHRGGQYHRLRAVQPGELCPHQIILRRPRRHKEEPP